MIIGIDASRANEEKKTGVGWYSYHVIQELKHLTTQPPNHPTTSQSLRVVLYTNKPLQGELADLPENWEEKVLHWFPKRLWTQIRLSWEMLMHKPDVLFIPAHVFPIIHPKHTVMTLHDIAAIRFPEAYNWFERWYTLWSGKFAVKNLWKVITISEFTKSELEKEFGSLNNVSVIHLGYNEEYHKIQQGIGSVLKKYKITKPYLLSIGRLENKKNTVNIIRAFEELRITNNELSLVLIGKPGHGYEKVKKVIENSEFKNDIITPGWVENDDLPILMNGAEVFVFPSLYEGFGIPVLEAQACGTPVVTSKGSSLEEVGKDACIYVDPQNVDEIVDNVAKLIEDNELREKMITKGFKNIERFSWEKCARETLNHLIT